MNEHDFIFNSVNRTQWSLSFSRVQQDHKTALEGGLVEFRKLAEDYRMETDQGLPLDIYQLFHEIEDKLRASPVVPDAYKEFALLTSRALFSQSIAYLKLLVSVAESDPSDLENVTVKYIKKSIEYFHRSVLAFYGESLDVC